jgi:phage shock protein C
LVRVTEKQQHFLIGTLPALILAAQQSGQPKRDKGIEQCSAVQPSAKRPRSLPAHSYPQFCSFLPQLRCPSRKRRELKEAQMNGRFLINRSDAKVMGVAAGLADYTGVDPTIVRLTFVALTLLTGPVMILFYVLTGLLAPHR